MHGQFYSHQHYLRQPGVAQNASSNSTNAVRDMTQQGQLQFTNQHPGMINGQAFQPRTAQQPQQQQRLQQMQHHAEQLTQQQYAQLLQNQSYQQALYNQALQTQTLQNNRQQEQQRLLHQQQNAASEQTASLRALLAHHQYPREALTMQQQITLNQLGLGQSSVSPHPLANLQHQHAAAAAAKNPSLSQQYQDDIRNLSRVVLGQQQQQRSHQDEAVTIRSRQPHGIRTMTSQGSSAQDLLNLPRHVSPTTPGRSPPGFAQNPNLYSNVLVSPQGNSGLISPHRNAFSPAMGHLARPHTTPVQMASRTDLNTVQTQEIPMQGSYQPMLNRTVSQDMQSPTRMMPETPGSGSEGKTTIHVKRQTPSVNSCSAPVIIVDSDDEDDADQQQTSASHRAERKGLKEEPSGKTDFTRVVIDDDIEITGVREAEIMSHMRPDCPIHTFRRVDNVNMGPQAQNALKCGKCYCYVCDKLANECKEWSTQIKPHCNAHPRASCWKARRNTKRSPLMLKLSSDEITAEMVEAGDTALQFMIQIREVYITYRNGIPCEYDKVPCNCQCHRSQRGHEARAHEPCISCKVIHDVKKRFNYQPVREMALTIIREIQSKYSRDHPEMALIMLEAILSELCSQRPADFNHTLRMPSNPDKRCQCDFPQIVEEYIEKELIDILTQHEVTSTFLNHLVKCVEEAIKLLQLKDIMKKFLSMRHWNNLLLRAVLSGSNTSGSQGREVLQESPDVIKLRVEKLDKEKRFQSIYRYLKTVKILQAQSSKVSMNQIMVLMDQWMLLYAAKQGHFKDVVLRLTEPIPVDKTQPHPSPLLHTNFQPDFLIQLLDALSGKDAQQTTRLDSFEPKNCHGPHIITGKDADVLLLLFHYFIQQNQYAATHVPLYIWLAKWVNRTSLTPCLDPNRIKPWRDQGSRIMETAMQAFYQRQCQQYLLQCGTHDPHVHLFNASINIVNAVSKYHNIFKPEHLDAIMDAYKNNEWALFLLVTQSPIMGFHNVNVLRWVTKFCEASNGSLTQIKDRVIIESIQPYELEDVTMFLKSLIKLDWVNSIESIQQTVLAVTSEYALRLLDEMKRCDLKALVPKAKWLEDIVLKYFEEQKISTNLLREEVVINYLKNVSKVCSFLNPIKRNIELYRKISPSTEWLRRCSTLIQFLAEKFSSRERMAGCMDEFSTLLWLLWMIGDLERLGSYFAFFQDRHSCSNDRSKVTSSKIIEEVAILLDSSPNPETLANKRLMVERCRRLCVLETLSWLTCTDCATKMSSDWSKIWISIANSKLNGCIRLLNQAMLEQFKMWLNKISLDSPENYKRLLGCLRSFLETLIKTWNTCLISYQDAGHLLKDVAAAVLQPRLRSDIESMSSGIIQIELDKFKPKVLEVPEPRPSNHLPQTPNHLHVQRPPNDLRVKRLSNDVPAQPASNSNLTQRIPQLPTQATTPTRIPSTPQQGNQQRTLPPPGVPKEPERRTVNPAQQPKRNVDPPPQHNSKPPSKPQAVMSTDALFKKKSQTMVSPPPKPAAEKQNSTPKSPTKDQTPFSPTNLTRTKKCQNCDATISRASFRCPKCNQAARSVQPVTCPQCHQENRELKGYACQYCYRSLLDVLFGGGERPQAALDDAKPEAPPRKKKRSSEKRRKKSKSEDKINAPVMLQTVVESVVSEEIEPQKIVPEPSKKATSPLTVRISKNNSNLSEDSSDSSMDDFVAENPSKKRKRHFSKSGKIPPIKLKRKPSNPSQPSQPKSPEPLHGASLTDSDSDSDSDNRAALIIAPEEINDTSRKNTEKMRFSPARPSAEHISHNPVPFSPQRTPQERIEIPKATPPRPQIPNSFNKARTISTENASPPSKPINSTHNSSATTQNALVKRGVGHSSTMSKKQKNILSRLKRPKMGGPKFPTKTTPPNSRPAGKDVMKSPPAGTQKRLSLDNGPMTSPGRNQVHERQRHDSSCSSGSVGSSSGLSFGLAKVAEKPRRNVGHRTGGPPGSGEKKKSNLKILNEVSPQSGSNIEGTKRTLFPQPLNNTDSVLNHGKKKNKKKKRELTVKMPWMTSRQSLEQRLSSVLTRRKPGPASRTNYRKILKIEHRLRKLQRPNRLWHIPSSVKLPANVDLSRYARVSLCLFPKDKLLRIQNLVPYHRLKLLYA